MGVVAPINWGDCRGSTPNEPRKAQLGAGMADLYLKHHSVWQNISIVVATPAFHRHAKHYFRFKETS